MMTALALLPIVSLFLCMVVLRLSIVKSGAISLIIALVVALAFFGLPAAEGLPIAIGKALWLALFVSLIVWGGLFLYHLVSDFGAIDVISKNIIVFVKDEFVVFLMLAWMFTGLLQGVAGFGVPAVIVGPILIALGFSPVKSLVAAMLGHSWAVTFGSMGAAFFVIQGITGIPEADLAMPMWIFGTVLHVLVGIGVCFVYDGIKGIKKGILYVLPVSLVMATVQFFSLQVGMYSLAGINAALSGLVALFLLYKLRTGFRKFTGFYKGKLSLLQAVFPYALILIMLLSFQLVPYDIRQSVAIAPSFDGFEATLEYPYTHVVEPVTNFNRIRLFVHPVYVLVCASIVAMIIFKRAGIWDKAVFRGAVNKTLKKGVPATLALLALGSMSLIMMDSGMTSRLAYDTAALMGRAYPIISPLFGVLGSFLTGNNTNSNVMFGLFQQDIARHLGVSEAMMASAQSIAGGLGVAIGPSAVLMGALAGGQQGKESALFKKLIPIVVLIALVMGVVNFTLLELGIM